VDPIQGISFGFSDRIIDSVSSVSFTVRTESDICGAIWLPAALKHPELLDSGLVLIMPSDS